MRCVVALSEPSECCDKQKESIGYNENSQQDKTKQKEEICL